MGGGDKLAERACRKRARERREGIAGHDKRRRALGGGPGMGGPIDPPTRRSARRPTQESLVGPGVDRRARGKTSVLAPLSAGALDCPIGKRGPRPGAPGTARAPLVEKKTRTIGG